MKWSAKQRQNFITETLKAKTFINRADIVQEFEISIPQASIDLRNWMKDNPDKIKYNAQAHRYESVTFW